MENIKRTDKAVVLDQKKNPEGGSDSVQILNEISFDATEASASSPVIYTTDLLNFAELPITRLGKNRPKSDVVEFDLAIAHPETNELVNGFVRIKAHPDYGLPVSIDDDVLLSLLSFAREQKFVDDAIYCTRYQLLKRLTWGFRDTAYRRLDESLNRLLNTRIKSDLHWSGHAFSVMDMGILQSSNLDRLDELGYSDNGRPNTFIRFNSDFWLEIQDKLTKDLNFLTYQSLDKGASKRLFRWLDKKFIEMDGIYLRYNFWDLVFNKIQLSKKTTIGTAKKRLRTYFQELSLKGIIEDLCDKTFSKESGIWYVYFKRGPFYSQKSNELPNWDGKQMNLLVRLKDLEFGEKERISMVEMNKNFPLGTIKTQAQWIKYVSAKCDWLEKRIEIEGMGWIKTSPRYVLLDAINRGTETEKWLDRLTQKGEELEAMEKDNRKKLREITMLKVEEKIKKSDKTRCKSDREKEVLVLRERLDTVPLNSRMFFTKECAEKSVNDFSKNFIMKQYYHKKKWIGEYTSSIKMWVNSNTLEELLQRYCGQHESVVDGSGRPTELIENLINTNYTQD